MDFEFDLVSQQGNLSLSRDPNISKPSHPLSAEGPTNFTQDHDGHVVILDSMF